MDIEAWLRELGLERYAKAFAEHHVDAAVLRSLTARDLEDMGIASVGHRRRLLAAIADLGRSAARAPAERRQITLLFADLVGSTQLAARLDPEDMRELLHHYWDLCPRVVERHEGMVARFVGDGVLAYFGYPVAHEDAPARAIRAGLDLVRQIALLPMPLQVETPLQARIGIHTGLVVVEGIGRVDAREPLDVVGEAPNIASRLQQLAEPDSVVISGATHRLVQGLFEVEDLGPHPLKGITEPVRVFRVLKETSVQGRFEAASALGLTSFVDRRAEMALLLERWGRTCAGDGQVILISGDPGIGKSRLVQAFAQHIEPEPHVRIRLHCSPYHTRSSLYPVIHHLEHAAGFALTDPPALRRHKLADLLGRSGEDVGEDVDLLASLLSIPSERPSPLHNLHPEQHKERTFATLLRHLRALASRAPLLLTAEDAHWIDPTTLELLELIAEEVKSAAVMLAVTQRPTVTLPWEDRPQVTTIALSRLPTDDQPTIVSELTGGKALPDEVLAEILAKTDGVPLFLEELTKTVLESGLLEERAGRWELVGPLPPLGIPATLQDSLIARLDRLAPVKEVAQVAAAIGREFSYALLALVSPVKGAALNEALDRLVEAALVFRRRDPPDASFAFKHALVRDAAYSGLLRSRRQQLHALIARALEERFPETAEAEPELLAWHYTEAGLADPGSRYWLAAGRLASRRSANIEAISHLKKGLALLEPLPRSPEIMERTLGGLVTLGPALIMTRGPGTREVEETYTRALEICGQLPPSPDHVAAHWGWWRISKDFRTMARRADQLLEVAGRLADPGLTMQAHHCEWATRFNLGDPEACCAHSRIGLDLYEQGDYRAHATLYGGHDAKVCGLGEMALALWLLGWPDQGLDYIARSLAHARELQHAGSLIHAMDIALMYHRYRRDAAAVRTQALDMIGFSEERRLTDHLAKGHLFLGWAVAQLGDVGRGLELMRQGLSSQRAIGTKEDFPIYSHMLAETLSLAGDPSAGQEEIAAAIGEAQEIGLCVWVAELHRCQGELRLLAGARSDEAERCFETARTIAVQQKARSLELRAVRSLAALWRRDIRIEAARAALERVLGSFSEGFATRDLQEAQALLQELKGQP